MVPLLFLAVLGRTLVAQPPQEHERLFLRLAEEADAFARLATKMVGQEKLEQVAAQPLPRFQQRGARPQTAFKTRQVVSEYAFSTFKDDPGRLHELRQVLSIDGKTVQARGKMRETLMMSPTSDSERTKRRMLKELESYGLREAATDFGQLLLMFSRRSQANFTFALRRKQMIGPDAVLVFAYTQRQGDTSMTVFEGKNVNRHLLTGELSLRASDGLPLRITMDITEAIKSVPLRRLAIVDYQQSAQGVMLPASVVYAESSNGQMLVENRFRYSDFRMFGANSDVKFTVDDTPPK